MLRDRCPVCPICLSVTLVYGYNWDQTVGWIKMPLGTEAGLGPGDIVLDGDTAPQLLHRKDHSSPHFSAHVIVYCRQTVGHLSYCWALVLIIIDYVSTCQRSYIAVCDDKRAVVLRRR